MGSLYPIVRPDGTLFAVDNYALEWNTCKEALKNSMQLNLELITDWLTQSGLKVNEDKSELCMFHRKDQPPNKCHLQSNNPNK